jgi:hypothetical protein
MRMTPEDDVQDLAACRSLAESLPGHVPCAHLVWTAVVDIAARESLGTGTRGERFLVPITGGRFWGAPDHEALCGRVRPGGADRQWLRPDGIKELHALYEMEVGDGTVLTIDNRVIVDESAQPARYAMSHIRVSAPMGRHAWLNRRLLVGTLQPLRPARQAVRIQAFVVDPAP